MSIKISSILKIVGISIGILAGLAGIGYGTYWRLTHLCVEWETVPTGEKCVDWKTTHHMCTTTDYNGHIKFGTCSETHCVRYVPCKECIRIEHVDNAPAELEKPQDRCGW
ncbi:MAG: hypothetical protein WC444_04245 [Candidatus Paceibacterota bacterium]